MPSQTLHDFRRYHPSLIVDSSALSLRPDFAVSIARTIMLWPHIEVTTSSMLARIVGSDVAIVMAMHTVLRKESSQTAALKAAVKTKLSSEDYQFFEIIFKLMRNSLDDRHIFAHWASGYSKELPQLLLFVQLEDIEVWSTTIYHITYNESEPPLTILPLDHRKVRAFRLEDATTAALRLEECYQFIRSFGDYHHLLHLSPDMISRMRPEPQPDRIREWLINQPRIRQALAEKPIRV